MEPPLGFPHELIFVFNSSQFKDLVTHMGHFPQDGENEQNPTTRIRNSSGLLVLVTKKGRIRRSRLTVWLGLRSGAARF